jgi:hypothetical protein
MSKDTSAQQQQQQQQYQQLDPSGRSASPSSVDSEQLRHDGRAAISVSSEPGGERGTELGRLLLPAPARLPGSLLV